MKARLTFSVVIEDDETEIEMMREQLDQAFDVSNAMWTFHDVTLDDISEETAAL